MQLNNGCLLLLMLMLTTWFLWGQENSLEAEKPAEIDFLLSYYQQDGDHSPVTGGRGTEELTDVAPMIKIVVPLPSNRTLSVTTGIDIYSSASTDNIDNVVSSASSQDLRGYLDLGLSFERPSGHSFGLLLGGSTEYDYTSLSGGGNWQYRTRDGNQEFGLSGKLFFDQVSLIYPVELRGQSWLDKNKRQTYNISGTWSGVINRRLQGSITTDLILQKGLLSTPFHRVFFDGSSRAVVEKLPDRRLKIPVGLQLHYAVNDWLVSRWHYRFYYDDFGILANTAQLELPLRVSGSFTISPYFRYHTQTAADDFYRFGEADSQAEFYTSDYDLSEFISRQYGLGLRYQPIDDIATILSGIHLRQINLRFSVYRRSDGLAANFGAIGLSFTR